MAGESLHTKLRGLRNFFFILLGAWLIGAGIYGWFLHTWLEHQDWKTTAGKVTHVEITEPPRGAGDECQSGNTATKHIMMVAVTYTYELGKTTYESDQFTHNYRGEVTCTREDAASSKARYEKNKSVTVYYDPEDPEESVLELPDMMVIFIFGPILVFLLILFVGWFAARRRRMKVEHAQAEAS